jgi:hypothetical protein
MPKATATPTFDDALAAAWLLSFPQGTDRRRRRWQLHRRSKTDHDDFEKMIDSFFLPDVRVSVRLLVVPRHQRENDQQMAPVECEPRRHSYFSSLYVLLKAKINLVNATDVKTTTSVVCSFQSSFQNTHHHAITTM